MPATDEAQCLARWTALTTCDIANALVKLNGGRGCVTEMNVYSPKDMQDSIVGPVYTVKMVLATDTDSPRPEKHFVDACPPGSIMVIQTPQGTKSACWGGLMSTAAKVSGIKGVIIDGACRDLAEHRALEFPVFARSHSTIGQGGFLRVSELGGSLTIAPLPPATDPAFPSTVVQTGDVAVADVDGVVIIPQAQLAQVLALAEELKNRDQLVEAELAAGMGVEEAMKKHRPGYRVDA